MRKIIYIKYLRLSGDSADIRIFVLNQDLISFDMFMVTSDVVFRIIAFSFLSVKKYAVCQGVKEGQLDGNLGVLLPPHPPPHPPPPSAPPPSPPPSYPLPFSSPSPSFLSPFRPSPSPSPSPGSRPPPRPTPPRRTARSPDGLCLEAGPWPAGGRGEGGGGGLGRRK